jgi:tetratricopeptide (TPR) repeat protein
MNQTNPRPKFIEAATIQERIDDVDALVARIEDDPADLLASSRLETIFHNQGDWESAIALLLDRAEHVDDAERLELLSETADIYENKVGDPEAALLVRLEAFRIEPDPDVADALDRLAYQTGQWDEVVDAYMIAAGTLGSDNETSSDLWLRVACAQLITTGDMGAVGEALDRVHSLDPERARAYLDMVDRRAQSLEMIETIVELCRRIGDGARMARALARGLAIAPDIATKARYHESIARVAEREGDRDTARWHYTEALRLDPTLRASREALVDIHRAEDNQREVAELLASSRFSASQTERARLALEAASIYADELDENTRAVNLYAFALAQDDEHISAALPLAERYWNNLQWPELAPILELLMSRYQELGPDAPNRELLAYRAGRCHIELGEPELGRGALTAALEIAPDYLDARIAYAEVCSQLGDHDAACDAYNAVLVLQRRRHAQPAALGETLYKMAETRRAVGDDDAAVTLYESALDLAYHPDALEQLRAIYERRGSWRGLVYALRCQLARADRGDKVKILCAIAEITGRHLADPHAAIDAYEDAHSYDPADRNVLCQLIEYYSAAEMWEQAVVAIVEVTDIEGDPIRRGKYFQAAATIARHHLDLERAVDHYNRALDCFFVEGGAPPERLRASCMKAFVDLSKYLYDAGEYKTLERSYRKMIRRMKAGDPELAELWHGLGQVYRKHLRRRDEAIESFEVASSLDEKRLTHHRILVDLYQDAGPETLDKAIERRHKLLAAEPYETDHYRALRRLYLRTERHDEAWTASRALCYLGKADPEEREDYHAHKPLATPWTASRLSEADWELLRHPDENRRITNLFTVACDAALLQTAASVRKLGLRNDTDPRFDHLRRMFVSVVSALGLPSYELCVQPELGGDVLLANVRRGRQLTPIFAVGRPLYDGQSVESITYTLARQLSYGRRGYLLRLAVANPSELEAVFLAAASLSRSDVPVPAQLVPWVQSYQASLVKHLPDAWRGPLAAEVEQFVLEARPYDIDGWCRAVDASCRRAGLLIAGDLRTAVDAIAREPIFTSGQRADDKVADLLVHSVSPQHHALRKELGLTIG